MTGDAARSTPAYQALVREPSGSHMLAALRWHSEGNLAFTQCRSNEHMELVSAKLTEAHVATVSSNPDELVITVVKSDLKRAFPQLFAERMP